MNEAINDFAAEFLAPDRPPRDSSGRPMIIPRDARHVDNDARVPYTRASSLGDILDEDEFLWLWKMRALAKGLADSMDLVRLVAAEDWTAGFTEDQKANAAAGRRIMGVIERAMDRAGVHIKADYGTAIHARTEPGNQGTDPDDKQAGEVESCWELWRELGVVHLATEVFTANDITRSAGTFDHLSFVPGYGIVVTDKKTSAKASQSYDVQLASYAQADIYDPETDERLTLEEYVESLGWDPTLINRSVGIIWWVKNGKTEPRFLDLDKGWESAKVAAWVRDNRRNMPVAKNVQRGIAKALSASRDDLLRSIENAPTVEDMNHLWSPLENQAIWTPDHTAAAKARKEAL